MKPALAILPYHEQRHDASCVAWGLELALKLHEKIGVPDYPLQSGIEPTTGLGPCDWGFGQKERDYLFQKHQLTAKELYFDLPDFDREAKAEALKGCPLLFSMIGHAWIAVLVGSDLECLSRTHNFPHILPPLPVGALFALLRQHVKPDYQIHCLLHS